MTMKSINLTLPLIMTYPYFPFIRPCINPTHFKLVCCHFWCILFSYSLLHYIVLWFIMINKTLTVYVYIYRISFSLRCTIFHHRLSPLLSSFEHSHLFSRSKAVRRRVSPFQVWMCLGWNGTWGCGTSSPSKETDGITENDQLVILRRLRFHFLRRGEVCHGIWLTLVTFIMSMSLRVKTCGLKSFWRRCRSCFMNRPKLINWHIRRMPIDTLPQNMYVNRC